MMTEFMFRCWGFSIYIIAHFHPSFPSDRYFATRQTTSSFSNFKWLLSVVEFLGEHPSPPRLFLTNFQILLLDFNFAAGYHFQYFSLGVWTPFRNAQMGGVRIFLRYRAKILSLDNNWREKGLVVVWVMCHKYYGAAYNLSTRLLHSDNLQFKISS